MSEPTGFSRALVLGATGMIGAHAVRACLRRGIAVRAFVRPGGDRRNLADVDAEVAEGDLADGISLGPALTGCDLLIHAAAPYPRRHFGKAHLLAYGRQGIESVLGQIAGVPLKRAIYVSSVTTIGVPAGPDGRPAPGSRPARESDREHPISDPAPYFALKAMLETRVLQAAAQGAPVVVVNPTFCVDALDARRTTAQLMIPLAKGQVPAYLPGLLNAVPTRDVGEGILQAAARGRPGERYILGGENMTSRAFLERCAREAGVTAPRIAMPLGVAEGISLVTELWAYLTRTAPLFPMTGIRMAKNSQTYDISKARDALGYRPTGVDAAIARAYGWYRAQGWL